MKSARKPDDPRLTPILLRKELIADGYTDRGIRRMVQMGQLAKLRRGAYADAAAYHEADDRGRHELITRAVLRQAKTSVVPSHSSGVALHDGPLYGLDLSSVDVTRLDGKAGRAEAGVRQHCGKVLDGDVVTKHGIDVMGPTRVALEVTTQAGIPESLCVVNDFLHRKLTTPEELRDRYGRGIESWGHTLHTDVVLRLAHPRIESVAESLAWHLIWSQHLPRPEPQHVIRRDDGEVGARLDFAWPELGAYLEVDGTSKYLKYLRDGETPIDAIVREKQREEWVYEMTQWRVIRILWPDLFRPEHTAARIRRVLFPTAVAS